MKKIFLTLIIVIFISIFGATATSWRCLSVELNDTTLTFQADSMQLRGGIIFQWQDGSPETDTIILFMGCINWKTLDDEVCTDCFGCIGRTFRVRLYETYETWLVRQQTVVRCWFGCNGPQPTITVSTDSSEFGNVVIGSSSMKMYYVSGSHLSYFEQPGPGYYCNIEITTPPGYQISTNTTNWSSSLLLDGSGGIVLDTIVYILFTPTETINYLGFIKNKSCAAPNKYITVSGTGYLSPLPECCEGPYPEVSAEEIPVNVNLSWQASDNALGYKIVIAMSEEELNELPLIDIGDTTEWTPTIPLQYNTTYYWRVTPYNSYGNTEFCEAWKFATKVVPGPNNPPEIEDQEFEIKLEK